MQKITLNILFLSMTLLAACGGTLDGKNVDNTKVVQYAVDEVKLINPAINNALDPKTFYTSEYSLNISSKLLMRLGTLRAETAKIVVEQPVLFRISVKSDPANIVSTKLKLCPIMSEWMMGATWTKPQRNHVVWDVAGGDFDMSSCISPMKKDDPLFNDQHLEEKNFCAETDVVCYDIKPYINAFIRSRNLDYGFGLINLDAQTIVVYGDRTIRGPEILWRKLKW